MKKAIVWGMMTVLALVTITVLGSCARSSTDPAAVVEDTEGMIAIPESRTGQTNAVEGEEAKEIQDAPEATATPGAGTLSVVLRDDYADALSARNQLALGSLRLEDTSDAITAEQAGELLLYWQALKTLAADSTTASEETAAVQDAIVDAMTPAQMEAITSLQLSNADLTAFYEAQGIVLTTSEPEPGVTPQGGKNSGLSQEAREATRTAAEALGTPVGAGGGSGSDRRDILIDTLIALLEARASE